MADKATKTKKAPKKAAEPKVDAKVVLQGIGAAFKEEQARSKSKKGKPRSEQTEEQLKATWMNSNLTNLDTRIDAYHHFHMKVNDGNILPREDIKVVLGGFDA